MADAVPVHDHAHDTADLTRNEGLVLKVLLKAESPLGAYAILDELRDDGLRAPLQVYRALDKLVGGGLVHRLESLNAFVACTQRECASHKQIAFAICEACGRVGEVADETLGTTLSSMARTDGFLLKSSTVELRGICTACQSG